MTGNFLKVVAIFKCKDFHSAKLWTYAIIIRTIVESAVVFPNCSMEVTRRRKSRNEFVWSLPPKRDISSFASSQSAHTRASAFHLSAGNCYVLICEILEPLNLLRLQKQSGQRRLNQQVVCSLRVHNMWSVNDIKKSWSWWGKEERNICHEPIVVES